MKLNLNTGNWLSLIAIILSLVAIIFTGLDFIDNRKTKIDVFIEPHLPGPVYIRKQQSELKINKPGYEGKYLEIPIKVTLTNKSKRKTSIDWIKAANVEPVGDGIFENVPALISSFYREYSNSVYQGNVEFPIYLDSYEQKSFYVYYASLIWEYLQKDDDLYSFFNNNLIEKSLNNLMFHLQSSELKRVQSSLTKNDIEISKTKPFEILTRPDGLSAIKLAVETQNRKRAVTRYSIHYNLYYYYVREGEIKPLYPIIMSDL